MKVWLGLIVTILLTACSMQELDSDNAKHVQTHTQQVKQYHMQTIHIQCPSCETVQLFDGFTLVQAKPENKLWKFQVSLSQKNPVVFATAKGKTPVIQLIKDINQPININITNQTLDSRLGTLTGIIADTSTSPNAYGISKVYPNTEIIVSRGRARQSFTTTTDGLFNIALSPGKYNVMVAGKLHIVDIPYHETTFLPIMLHHTIFN